MGSRRIGEDRVVYPDEDLMVVPDGTGKRRFVRKDATAI